MQWIVPPSPEGQWVALDVETTGLHWKRDRAFFMALSYTDGSDYWLDLREPNHLRWAQDHICKAEGLANHNLKFDLHFCREQGIGFPNRYRDTMVNAALLNEHLLDYSLDGTAERCLGQRKHNEVYQQLAALYGGKPTRKEQISRLKDAPLDIVVPYALQDTRLIFPLLSWQEPRLKGEDLQPVAAMEMELLDALLDLEHEGVRIDVGRAEEVLAATRLEQHKLQRELNAMCGRQIAVASRSDMTAILEPRWVESEGTFFLKDGTRCLLTKGSGSINKKTGDPNKNAPSLDASLLEACDIPEAKLIVAIRKMEKLCGTFLEGHVLGDHFNGRVYPNFHQTKSDSEGDSFGTTSGRMSCSTPNLMQIPSRNKKIKDLLRSIFLPEEGQLWVSADFSSIDFRVMCNYMNDPAINHAFQENPDMDFHQWVADMTGLPRNPVSGVKGCAKTINLGCAFGTSAGRVAKEMGLDYTVERRVLGGAMRDLYYAGPEAQSVFDKYHRELPKLKPMLDRMKGTARERRYIKTLLGRRSRFPGGEMAHKAGPMIFQGGAAEIMKTALIRLHKRFKGTGARLLNTVHDEASMSMPHGREDLYREMVEVMENTSDLPLMRIPVRASSFGGSTWAEAGKGELLLTPEGWKDKTGQVFPTVPYDKR